MDGCGGNVSTEQPCSGKRTHIRHVDEISNSSHANRPLDTFVILSLEYHQIMHFQFESQMRSALTALENAVVFVPLPVSRIWVL